MLRYYYMNATDSYSEIPKTEIIMHICVILIFFNILSFSMFKNGNQQELFSDYLNFIYFKNIFRIICKKRYAECVVTYNITIKFINCKNMTSSDLMIILRCVRFSFKKQIAEILRKSQDLNEFKSQNSLMKLTLNQYQFFNTLWRNYSGR